VASIAVRSGSRQLADDFLSRGARSRSGWEDLEIEEPEHVLLSISLGTAHNTWHSKLVAGVLRFG
jgi:hypothetical protein